MSKMGARRSRHVKRELMLTGVVVVLGGAGRRRLAAVARTGRHRRRQRHAAAAEVERDGKRRLEGAARRPWRLDPHRRRRSRLRDLPDGRERAACGQSSDDGAGWRSGQGRRASAWTSSRRDRDRCRDDLPGRSVQSQGRHAALDVSAACRRRAAAGARQTQPRVTESGERRPARLCLVRHRPARRARHGRQARLAASSRQGSTAPST